MIYFLPSIVLDLIKSESIKRGGKPTFIKFLLSWKTGLFIYFIAFIPAFIHFIIDGLIHLSSYVLPFKHTLINETDIWIKITAVYCVISVIIILVVSSLYFNSLINNKTNYENNI